MAHTPLKMSIDEAHNEVRIGWASSYSPEAIETGGGFAQPQAAGLSHKPPYRATLFPWNLLSANGALRLGENDSRKSAHHSQTRKAGVWGRATCPGAGFCDTTSP